ncbi:hypothetical protein [Kitasatospora sp. MBT63]|uniref:hypothetical protein n=1 Tax=Kitasatospora sp. MBT63 TaxID=1444768 RepID=UPI000539ED79|nr:hypothetical protein [Kitasatospora sp. MBT63]
MTTCPAHPTLTGLIAAWEACREETDRAGLAALATAMPGAAPGIAPATLLAPAPGGGRITIRLERGFSVTLTAERVPVAAVQALVDHGGRPGWFGCLVTTSGEYTERLADADPDEYGEPSPYDGREDTVRVRLDGTADLRLHRIGLRAAVGALQASARVFAAGTATVPVPAAPGRS